jgi:hypothetical protein
VHSVAWNCNTGTSKIVIQKPPTAQNYAIGCTGVVTGTGPFSGPQGFIEGTNLPGLNPGSLYKAQLADRLQTTSSIDDHRGKDPLPKETRLHQNFPNPFNPTTAISFRLSAISSVTLKVVDVLGREVATLVNEYRQPGLYTVRWDASGLSSGVYFYCLEAGSFIDTKKLVVLK